MMISKFNLYH